MAVSFHGMRESYLTFLTNGTVNCGDTVKMYANDTVKTCADGDQIIGVVKSVRNGYATVQVTGTVTMGYTGNAPTVGLRMIDADGSNGASIAANGRTVLVLSVDTTAGTFTAIL